MTQSLHRRDFFKLALAGAVAGTVGTGLSSCSTKSNNTPLSSQDFGLTGTPAINFTEDCEVLIVGSGIAGLSAAIEPLRQKRKVLMVEKLDLLGGESYHANGVFLAAGTRIQKQAGLAADIDAAWKSFRANLPSDLDPLALAFQEKLFRTQSQWVDYLEAEMGAEFADPSTYMDKDDPRAMLLPKRGIGDMESIMTPFKDTLVNWGLVTHTDLSASAFITDPDGIVSGMRFRSLKTNESIDISAQKIIMASGGFVSNQQMVAKNLSDWVSAPCQTTASMGEGQQLCAQINGKLTAMNHPINLISDIPTVSDWGSFAPVLALSPWGKRFAPEDQRFAAANKAYAEYMGYWWCIFDKQLMESKQTPNVAKTIQKNLKRTTETCNTLEELAKEMVVPLEALQQSFEEYEQAIEKSKADPYGRTRFLRPLEPPYKAIKVFPSRYISYGGAATDDHARLISNLGQVIKNVFCCGACAEGCFSGLSSAGAFGWIAGQTAAEELADELPLDDQGNPLVGEEESSA